MTNEAPDPDKLAQDLRAIHEQLQQLMRDSPHVLGYATAAEHLEAAIAQLDPSTVNPD